MTTEKRAKLAPAGTEEKTEGYKDIPEITRIIFTVVDEASFIPYKYMFRD